MEKGFIGLVPKANEIIGEVIGEELEVIDIEDVISDEPIKKVNHLVKRDYKELEAEFSKIEAQKKDFYYWESHITLKKKLEEVESIDEIQPYIIENIFEFDIDNVNTVITRVHNLETGEESETRVLDEWYESHVILPKEFVLNFEEAVKIYWESEKTTGDKVSMRRPLNPRYKHPYYIFGQIDSPRMIMIDAVTGEIE